MPFLFLPEHGRSHSLIADIAGVFGDHDRAHNAREGCSMNAYKRLRKELFRMRQTWKAETGRKNQYHNDKITFIDGVVFGLTIAINTVDKLKKDISMIILLGLFLSGCRTPNSNDVLYSKRTIPQGELR